MKRTNCEARRIARLADSLAGEAEEHLGVVVVVAVPRGRRGSPRGEALKRLVRVRQPLDEQTRRREGDATDPERSGRGGVPGAKGVTARADVVTARFAVEEGRPHRMTPGAAAARLTVDAIADDYCSRMTWSQISCARPTPPSVRRFADHETTRDALDRTRIRFSPVAADAPARVRPPRASNLAVRLRHPEQDSVSLLSAHFSSRARPEDSRFPFATVFLTVRGLESIPSQPRSALARIVSRHPRRARGTPPARRDEEARLRASPRASRPPRFEASPTLYAAADPSPSTRTSSPTASTPPAPHRRDIHPRDPGGDENASASPRPRVPRPREPPRPGRRSIPSPRQSRPRCAYSGRRRRARRR